LRAKRASKAGSSKRAAGQFLVFPQYPQEQPLPFPPGACDTGYTEYEAPFPRPDGAILSGHKVDEYLASYAGNKGHRHQQGVPCVLQALQQEEQQLQQQQQVCLCVRASVCVCVCVRKLRHVTRLTSSYVSSSSSSTSRQPRSRLPRGITRVARSRGGQES
jgi:hypothetical protein